MRPHHLTRALAASSLVLALAACAGTAPEATSPAVSPTTTAPQETTTAPQETTSAPAEEPTPPEPEVASYEFAWAGGDVSGPSSISAAPGETFALVVTSDEDLELHVHAPSDEVLEVPAGATETFELSIDATGRFSIETHPGHKLLTQIQVS